MSTRISWSYLGCLAMVLVATACGSGDDLKRSTGAGGGATELAAQTSTVREFVPIAPRLGVPYEGSPARREIMVEKLEGRKAPELKIKTWLNVRELTLSSLVGEVVMLDFWGSWCAPCRTWTEALKGLHEKYKDRGFFLIGIHTGKKAAAGRSYIRRENITYPVGFDYEDGRTIKDGYGVDSYPDFYFIDHRGILRYADVSSSASVEEIESIIEALLAERERDRGGR